VSETLWASLCGLNRARLITAAVVLAVGILLRQADAFPYSFSGFGAAVLATAALGMVPRLAAGYVTDLHRVARLQLALDVTLVTAIVAITGVARSIFVPLYVLIVMAASFVLPRADALGMAALASVLYVTLVLGDSALGLLGLTAPSGTSGIQALTIVLNAGVLPVIAAVTSSLAQRYRESQTHLEAERKHLSDVQAFRDLIFQSVGSGLVAVDPDGRVTAFNRAAESITGVLAEHALGRAWHDIFGDGVDLDEARRATAAGGPLPRRYEFPLRHQDGRQVPVGISFWSLRSGGGAVVGLIGVCQDLSSIKQLEQRMRQADRLATVGRLSANMAHEIRNPLASISGAVEALAKELPPDEGRNRLVEIVLRESGRLNHIVADFLEYARPAPLSTLDVNLAEILDEVLLLIEHRALPANFKVVREYGESLPARVDPQQMRQAIWNLCLNAVQAMPEGGEMRVGGSQLADPARRAIQIWINDTGTGIADEDMPHIFEPFYSTKPEGSGLGLALVYRVLQDHGGHIDARSRPGEGTTFTVTLPAADEPSHAVHTPAIARRP
jgi:two-component system sensor histidine kinase PilS (NtrC family)